MNDSYQRNITYLRLAVTDECNLRCRYCMPEGTVCHKLQEPRLSQEELLQAVEAAAELGIRKLRITGGEPLLRQDILTLCRRAAAVPGIEEVCLTSNATLLADNAAALKEAGVKRLNLSLDTLNPDKFRYITRGGSLARAWAGITAALDAGFEKIKLNVVLIGGFNDDEIPALAELTMKYPLDVRFIELMPMVDSGFGPEAYLPCSEVLNRLPDLQPAVRDGGVATLYRLPGALGSIGLISPISRHFCAACNRIRITPDGMVKPCLHSSALYDLKGLDKAGMKAVLATAISQKPLAHPPLSAVEMSEAGRSMNQIGG